MTEPDFTDPDEYQQDAIDELDRRTGFNSKPTKSKPKPKPQIQKMDSMEEWRTLVKSKYNILKK